MTLREEEIMPAHTALSTAKLEHETYDEWALRTYCPSFPGVHLCGADHIDDRFFTVLDLPARSDTEAKALWQAIRADCEVPEEEADFTVDLNTRRGHEDDFWSNRQMLPRIATAIRKLGSDARG